MTPEQQAIIKALLAGGMPEGDMSGASPLRQRAMMQQAQNAQQALADAYYDAPVSRHPAQSGAFAGMSGQPFDAREAMSAPQGRTEAAPGLDALFQSLSVQEKSAIMDLVQQGAPIEQAFEAILGGALSAAAQGQ